MIKNIINSTYLIIFINSIISYNNIAQKDIKQIEFWSIMSIIVMAWSGITLFNQLKK